MISFYGIDSAIARMEQKGKPPAVFSGLTKPAKALLVMSLARRLDRPVVVLFDKAARAEEFYRVLRFFAPKPEKPGDGWSVPLLFFPPWEILPYEDISPHPDIMAQRIRTLSEMAVTCENFVLVTTITAMARKIAPVEVIKKSRLKIDAGDSIDMEILADHLVAHGYRRTQLVNERGEFSIRGGIVDIFGGPGKHPVRMELFGDTVESVRFFSPESQRSISSADSVFVMPCREVFYEGVDVEQLTGRFDELCAGLKIQNTKSDGIRELLRTRSWFPGMEKYLPLFFPNACSLFDYLPETSALIIDEPEETRKHYVDFMTLAEEEFEADTSHRHHPAPCPDEVFVTDKKLYGEIGNRAVATLNELALSDEKNGFIISTRAPTRYKGSVENFMGDLRKMISGGYKVALVSATVSGMERLYETLKENDLGAVKAGPEQWAGLLGHMADPQPSLFGGNMFIIQGKISEGLIAPADKWALVTEEEIFDKARRTGRRRLKRRAGFSQGIDGLLPGGLVIHRAHGLGRYIGAKEMIIDDSKDEYLEIEYAENQRLYVPMNSIDAIARYTGGGGGVHPLDKMGGSTWLKRKAKVKKSLLAMADKLLKMYAARELGTGVAFSADTDFHRQFSGAFEYEETEDQLSAINDTLMDMESEKPMDRLVCGDVGYGKTEVAMRAAFKAVYDGKQVAVLVPTTLLAQQHYNTFTERFKAFPVSVEVLNRFKSRKEQKEIISRVASGSVDILIGAHRLIQKDVTFRNLGLVIVDEEQKFGVRGKEKLRETHSVVDALTLTATPIPRTLHNSLLGIKDLSVIETPPPARQSIKTFITRFSGKIIRKAVLREMDRGGQVFFVHNRVKSIREMAKYISKQVPTARVAVAHGQLPEKELERIMVEFIDRQYDILLCSTIIESGLDIPSANTIMINRADQFGLAQLYQLRGRVGRDRHRAYSYLFIPGRAGITSDARKRLKAIEELGELGSGFKLSARDMEIRGAGNLLGAEQSGQIDAVGFDTYCEMIRDTISELRGAPVESRFRADINIGLSGRISPEYAPGLAQRMELYNRLNSANEICEVDDIEEEMNDRFGAVPEETEKLLIATRIRVMAGRLKIEKVDATGDRVYMVFNHSTKLAPEKLTGTAGSGLDFRFVSDSTVEFRLSGADWREKSGSILELFAFLAGLGEKK